MSFLPSPGVVVAIAVGGSLVLFIVLATSVVLIARVREKRRFERTNAAEETRLARHPEGHRNMIADDIPRPRPGILRRSIQDPYTYSRGWNKWKAISSCESLPRHPPMATVLEPSIAASDSMARRQSWSFLHRSIGPNALVSNKSKAFPLSPIAERSVANTEFSPEQSATTRIPQSSFAKEKSATDHAAHAIDPYGSLLPDSPALAPAPLFHNKRRSYSSGNIGSLHRTGLKPTISFQETERPAKEQFRRSRFSRSISQPSGLVPDRPMPPLPLGMTRSTPVQAVPSPAVSSPNRASGVSLSSANSFLICHGNSKSRSQGENEFALNSLGPQSSGTTATGLGIYHDSRIWDCITLVNSADSPGPSTVSLHKEILPQKSFRISNQSNATGSASGGLSMSPIDQEMCSQSASDATRLDLLGNAKPSAAAERWPSPTSSSKRTPFDVNGEGKSKRASTSVLQEISGNHSGLRSELGQRPRSIPTDNPFQWNPQTMMKASKSRFKGSAKVYKRQNNIRKSKLGSVAMTPIFVPTAEETDTTNRVTVASVSMSGSPAREEDTGLMSDLITRTSSYAKPLKSPISGLFTRTSPSNPIPPSIPSFEFQLMPGADDTRTSVYSPTLAMANFYNRSDHSLSSDDLATPTKPPRQTETNNQARTLTKPNWPLPEDPIRHLTQPFEEANGGMVYGAPRPPSTLFQFPEPPLVTKPALWRFPSPIRGPRDAPPKPPRNTDRTSPTKTFAGCRDTPSPRKSNDLRKQILALRRMNSESEGGRGHVRYLSALGGSPEGEEWLGARGVDCGSGIGGQLVREGMGGAKVGDGRVSDAGVGGRGVKGPREIGTREREASFYDDNGILKEGM